MDEFSSEGYQNINRARLDHLAGLGLDLQSKTVLELGAAVGDLTKFWLERNCTVTCIEGRRENLAVLNARYPFPQVHPRLHDLDSMDWPFDDYQIVFAYGILYHLQFPEAALMRWSLSCRELFLLETVVTRGIRTEIKEEVADDPRSGLDGWAAWPARSEITRTLNELYEHVYQPVTPPDHIEFPGDWNNLPPPDSLVRAIYIASREPLDLPTLVSAVG